MQEDKEAANVQFIKKIFPPEVVVIGELRELIAFSLDTLREEGSKAGRCRRPCDQLSLIPSR